MHELWVAEDFEVPLGIETEHFRLEPLAPHHNSRDYAAWMSSIEHIHNTPGFPRGESRWPYSMPSEENLSDINRHADDFERRKGFTYSVLDGEDVIGCVYLYPPQNLHNTDLNSDDYDAEVMSWVSAARSELDTLLWQAVVQWLADKWPFKNILYATRL